MDNTLAKIKEKADIISVIEKYIPLKNAGRNMVGICPFHNEKTPSFSVSSELGIYKCFGCGKTGDAINFVMEIEKIEFKEAIKKLAEWYGIEYKDREYKPSVTEILNNFTQEYFESELRKKENHRAIEYIKKRGFTRQDVEKFHIGYAPKNGTLLKKIREKYKYTNQQLVESGIYVIKENGIREKFRDRIIFPVYDTNGRLIAFNGRLMPDNEYGPKYLHSPETELFHKKDRVYGLNLAKSQIRLKDLTLLCEGAPDVIASHRVGVENIVAPLGTGLTTQQLQLISRFSKNVAFVFNSDTAGVNATTKAFILATNLGMVTFAINLAPYKDIDEMVMDKKDEYIQRIDDKMDAFTYIITNKLKETDTTNYSQFTKLKNEILEIIAQLTDVNSQHFYTTKAEELTGVKFDTKGKYSTYTISTNSWQNNQTSLNTKFDEIELYVLTQIIQLKYDINKVVTKYFTTPILQELIEIIKTQGYESLQEIAKDPSNNHNKIVSEILLNPNQPEQSELEKGLERIEQIFNQKELLRLRKEIKIAETEGNDTLVEEITIQIMDISSKIKHS